jgi:hypothetical protein
MSYSDQKASFRPDGSKGLYWGNDATKAAPGHAPVRGSVDVKNLAQALLGIVDASGLPEDQRHIVRDHVETALYEAQVRIDHSGIDDRRSPVPELGSAQVQAIKEQGKLHPWSSRRPEDRRWPVEWVRDYYGAWIPGLLKGHILQADPKLYAAFMKHVSRKGLPGDMDIPSEAENRIRSISNPQKRQVLVLSRKLNAGRVRNSSAKTI